VVNYKQQKLKDNIEQNKQKAKKIDQINLFTCKREFLKISVDSQTALAAETHVAERQWRGGATERGKDTYVPSRNTNAADRF
jgi:7-cyano-7-deazaguanine synthase in queuosine biosynthesis